MFLFWRLLVLLSALFARARFVEGFSLVPNAPRLVTLPLSSRTILFSAEETEQELTQQQKQDEIDGDGEKALPVVDVLSLPPQDIGIVDAGDYTPASFGQDSFVKLFRGSANYIANHRNTIAVYHIPGSLIEQGDNFRDLINDVALTWLLGMKIVLVVGCRYQVDKRVPDRNFVNGILVTDANTLRVVKEEAGYVRFEVEREMARSLRVHGSTDGDGNVVSGNFFSAQPFGVLDGTDYLYSGFVRRVEVEKIRQVHTSRDIVLMTTLGVSPSGEVFNVNSEALAANAAGALGASKLVYFTESNIILKHKTHGNQIQSLRLKDAKTWLAYKGIQINKRGPIKTSNDDQEAFRTHDPILDTAIKIGWATISLDQGVKRAHILPPTQGAVLQELYTRDGSGTLISRDLYEGIRQATVNDIVGIYDLISPLIKMGTLVDRPKAQLEREIGDYYVLTRDNLVVACGQLKQFEDGFAEIACLVVHREYRSLGRGDSILSFLERLCLQKGGSNVFVLSTQTMEWFIERGFEEVVVDRLPPSRKATYNRARASKIYMKHIDDRELDASELWWNR